MTTTTVLDVSICVENLATGRWEWIDIQADEDSIQAAKDRFNCLVGQDDYEIVDCSHSGIGVSRIQEACNLAEALDTLDEEQKAPFLLFLRNEEPYLLSELDNALERFEDEFLGIFESETDFIEEHWMECYQEELDKMPDILRHAIDPHSIWRQLNIEGYWSDRIEPGQHAFFSP